MNPKKFAKGVERLINPIEVGNIHTVQQLNKLLPKGIQNKITSSSGRKFPEMGFVVEPYSFFLFYEIKDIKKAQNMLPEGFKLIKTGAYEDDIPKYYAIFGVFRAHTSAFWGARTEFYVIAEDENTGLLTWVIVDYDTNTIGYDKKNGLRSPNCSDAVITINHRGRVFVDFQRDDGSRQLAFDGGIEKGKMRNLDQRLWLEGNLSVVYGKDLEGNSNEVFSLKFEPCEVEKALDIPLEEVNIDTNTWYPDLFEETPSIALCFPYAQHFISDSPGFSSQTMNKEELINKVKATDFTKIEVFNTKAMRDMFVIGMLLNTILVWILLIIIIFF